MNREEDNLPEESFAEQVISELIEKTAAEDTILSATYGLSKSLEHFYKMAEGKPLTKEATLKALARAVFHLTMLSYLLADPDELDYYLDMYAQFVREEFS